MKLFLILGNQLFAPKYLNEFKDHIFYMAEDYHQDYYKKNPTRYNYYRWSCGRDKRLMQLWGAKKD